MGNLFNMENPVWSFIGKLADVILLNILWIICCIPIVTIGPATTALYYVTLKLAENEEGYTVKSFFYSFKANLKQGMVIGIIMSLAGAFLIADHILYIRIIGFSTLFNQIVYALLLMVTLIYILLSIYIYPMLARFENPIMKTFKNSLFIAIRHLPSSALMLVVTIAMGLVSFVVFPPLMLFGIALIAFLNSFTLTHIFKKYMPEKEINDEFKELSIFSEEEKI